MIILDKLVLIFNAVENQEPINIEYINNILAKSANDHHEEDSKNVNNTKIHSPLLFNKKRPQANKDEEEEEKPPPASRSENPNKREGPKQNPSKI